MTSSKKQAGMYRSQHDADWRMAAASIANGVSRMAYQRMAVAAWRKSIAALIHQ